MRYIKKSIPVEAIQWTGNNFDKIVEFMGTNPVVTSQNELIVNTENGEALAELNSFIVRGPEGDFYPVKENIFRDTYDIYSNCDPQGSIITCRTCGETTFVEHPNLSYDGCLKKYFYWYLCPYCGTKINWGN